MARWLRDAETGELFPADEFDSSSYEVVGSETFGAEQEQPRSWTTQYPSWMTSLGGVPARGIASAAEGGAGALELLGDVSGIDALRDFGIDTKLRARDLADQARRENEVEAGSGWDIAQGVGGDLLANGPLLAKSLLTQGGKLLGGAAMSTLPSFKKYANLRERGADVGEAAVGAGESFALNSALNALDIGSVLKAIPATSVLQQLYRRAVPILGTNVATNAASTVGDLFIDAQAGTPQSQQEFIDALKANTIAGLGTGAAFTGLSALPRIRRQSGQQSVSSVEGLIDSLADEGAAIKAIEPEVLPPLSEPQPDAQSRLETIAIGEDPNFFTTNPDQLPIVRQAAEPPAEFPFNVPGPRSVYAEPAPPGWNQGQAGEFLFKDPAEPPALRPEALPPAVFPLEVPGPSSPYTPPAPDGWERGSQFLFKDPAELPAVRPEASPPALLQEPAIDPTQYQGPTEGFALSARPTDVGDLTRPPIEEGSAYDARSAYRQRKAAQDVKSIEAELETTRRRIADQERVNRTNQVTQRPAPTKPMTAENPNVAFDDPMARIAKAAEEAKAKEQPLIASPDDSPLSVSEVVRNVGRKIADTSRAIYEATKTSERGYIDPELLGLGKVSKEVKKATKGDRRYTKYEPKHVLAARNWMATDTIGKDVPEVKPLADAILNLPEDNSKALASIEPELMALYKTQGDDAVNGVIWKAEEKGPQFSLTPENISKLNLSDEQVAAIQASKKLQLKASSMLRDHSSEIANREYSYKVKRANIEVPARKTDIEQKYQADLEQLRREALDPTDPRVYEATKQLTEKRDADLLAVDSWLSDTVNRAANERYNTLRAVEQRQATWDQTNYVPRNRYGKYKMKVFDANGELYEDRQTDSKADLTKWKKAYEDAGLVTSIELLKQRAPTEHFNGVSDEVATSVDPVGGFKKHLLRSRRIPGADMDPVRAWSEYFRGLSKKMAIDRMEMSWKESMLQLPRDPRDPRQIDVNLSQVVNELNKRKEAVLSTKSGTWGYLSKVTDLTNLTFQLRTPISNLFAIPQRQYPELTKYGAQPETTIAKSFGINLNRLRLDDAEFAKKYPDLARGIAIAESNKTITPVPKSGGKWTNMRAPLEKQVSRIADNKSKILSTFDDVAFFLQFHSDRFAESNGFITGWEAYPQAVKHFKKNGLEVPGRQQFAEQFAKDTKANVKGELLPPWMQGMAQSTTLKYKTWQLRYLGALLDAAGKGNRAYLGRAIGATMASAGVRGLPFYKTAVGAMTALGFSPEDSLQEVLDENLPDGLSEPAMTTLTYGPLSAATGVNFSGSTGFGDPLPDTSRGFEAAIGSLIGGPAASLGRKIIDFPGYLKRGQTDRAIENLPISIPLVTNLAKAYRIASEGVVTKGGVGIVPKEDVTGKMLAAQMFGYGDLKTSRAYDKYLAGERAGAGDKDSISYPSLIAEAIVRGDDERVAGLIEEAAKKGKQITPKDIMEKVAKRKGIEGAIVKKYPKATRGDAAVARRRFD